MEDKGLFGDYFMIKKEYKTCGWFITLCNYTSEEYSDLMKEVELARYLVVGEEICPTTQTPHYHAFIYYKNDRSFSKMKKLFPRAHIEVCKKPKECREYCMKDGDYVEFGEMIHQGKRNDLQEVRKVLADTGKMRDVVNVATSYQSVRMAETILKYHEKPRNWKPKVYWFYGATGTGKSKTAYEILGSDCYTTLDTGKWWEGYDGHENVHIEDMRRDFMKFHQLLKLLDRYAYRIECKGGSRQFLAKNIIITSCFSPYEMYETREDIQQLIRRIDEIREFTHN